MVAFVRWAVVGVAIGDLEAVNKQIDHTDPQPQDSVRFSAQAGDSQTERTARNIGEKKRRAVCRHIGGGRRERGWVGARVGMKHFLLPHGLDLRHLVREDRAQLRRGAIDSHHIRNLFHLINFTRKHGRQHGPLRWKGAEEEASTKLCPRTVRSRDIIRWSTLLKISP